MTRLLLILVCGFFSAPVFGQIKRDVSGYFQDSRTKRASEEVPVQLVHTQSGKTYKAVTDENGKFLFKDVALDANADTTLYELSVSDEKYRQEKFVIKIDADHTD